MLTIFPLESVFWVLLIWCAAIHGVAKSRTQLRDWTELNWIRVQSRPACVVIIQCSPRLRSAVFSCSPHPMTDSEVLLVVLLPRLEQLAENGGFAAPFLRCRKCLEATAQAIELADAGAGTGSQVSLFSKPSHHFSLPDLLHSVWQTLGPVTSLQITQFISFLWLSNICRSGSNS